MAVVKRHLIKVQYLNIKIRRDMDGDVLSDLTAERCLEKEYRSQITIITEEFCLELISVVKRFLCNLYKVK